MALVTRFQEIEKPLRVHSTSTVCGYMAFSKEDRPYLELNTYAAGNDQDLDKPKQLLQFDEASAKDLIQILKRAFPHLFA